VQPKTKLETSKLSFWVVGAAEARAAAPRAMMAEAYMLFWLFWLFWCWVGSCRELVWIDSSCWSCEIVWMG